MALVCCRRPINVNEYLPVLLGEGSTMLPSPPEFEALLTRRWQVISGALDTAITNLDDPGAYQPALADGHALAQQWAHGFLAAVRAWPQEWAGPRNKQAQKWRSASLDRLQALTREDTGPRRLQAFTDAQGPPSVSHARLAAVADALWAVYNMRDMWRTLGPGIAPHHAESTPGRNAACSCGSGKKFKKCCAHSAR